LPVPHKPITNSPDNSSCPICFAARPNFSTTIGSGWICSGWFRFSSNGSFRVALDRQNQT